MPEREEGEYQTFDVTRVWSAATPDGQKALILELNGRMPVALRLTDERIQILMAKLSELLALSKTGGKA